MPYIAEKNLEKCTQCGFCDEIACSSTYVGSAKECTGCGACSLACPYEAIQMIEIKDGKSISISVDKAIFSVPDRVTVKKALEMCGYEPCEFPGDGNLFSPCRTGGCWSCAVLVNGELRRINEDDRNLCKLAISELGAIFSDLGLSKEELDLLDMLKRSFIVHFSVRMDSGKVKLPIAAELRGIS